MIMNPPSHRILLASVEPCYPCFGIIHLDENGWANLTRTLALPIAVGRKVCRRPALSFLLCHFIHKGQPAHTCFKLSARNDSLTESLATDRCPRRHGRFLCGD